MQDLEQWLQSHQDYSEGIQLFNKYSGNQVLKKLFQHSENAYRKSRLFNELQRIFHIASKSNKKNINAPQPVAHLQEQNPIAPVPVLAQEQPTFEQQQKVAQVAPPTAYYEKQGSIWVGEWHTLPNDVKDCINNIKDKAKERDALRHRLEDMNEEERALAATNIVTLDDTINELREKLAAYKESGTYPEEKKQEATDIASILKRINTVRTYISRDKNVPEKLEKWKNELAELEQKLK